MANMDTKIRKKIIRRNTKNARRWIFNFFKNAFLAFFLLPKKITLLTKTNIYAGINSYFYALRQTGKVGIIFQNKFSL
jgi:hypothetical protein